MSAAPSGDLSGKQTVRLPLLKVPISLHYTLTFPEQLWYYVHTKMQLHTIPYLSDDRPGRDRRRRRRRGSKNSQAKRAGQDDTPKRAAQAEPRRCNLSHRMGAGDGQGISQGNYGGTGSSFAGRSCAFLFFHELQIDHRRRFYE